MKLFSIVLAATFVSLGCETVAVPNESTSSSSGTGGSEDTQNLVLYTDGVDKGYNECDRVMYSTVIVDGKEIVYEMPTLCNPQVGPDRGDPGPDTAINPNPDIRERNNKNATLKYSEQKAAL